jgi:cytochrome c peroxidase
MLLAMRLAACVLLARVALACDGDDAGGGPAPDAGLQPDAAVAFEWNLPPGFPRPVVPEGNPMSRAKVELGRFLFYDARLSDNETQSCASCHQQALAFSDGRATGLGSTGESHPRNAMSIANVAYTATLTWANPLMVELERQADLPLYGDAPVELGLPSRAAIEERLRGVELYRDRFAEAFPDDEQPVNAGNMNKALAAFQRTLISGRSPFDRWFYEGEPDAISESAQRGYMLFNEHPFECFHCHDGFNFSDHTRYEGQPGTDAPYHNTGLYNVDSAGGYPEPNTGVHDVTRKPTDMGRFKAPTLRNVAVTAPYMHDGSIATLSEVLDHYAAGGRTIRSGPNAGIGSESPLKNSLVASIPITEQQRADLIAFLESLTDEEFLTDPNLADPWQ